jgi:DNA adenine methylase
MKLKDIICYNRSIFWNDKLINHKYQTNIVGYRDYYMEKITIPTFIKWAGGKTQLLKQFQDLFPKDIYRYFEPMVGSGAVFFFVEKKYKPNFSMISDINDDLINLYINVRDDPEDLITLLKEHKLNHKKNPKKYYYKMRELFNKTKDPLDKSALLLYLNKTCYNGLYRVNLKGEFNVPFGRYKNPAILQEKKLRTASKLMKNVEIKKMSFLKILDFTQKDDFIYFDPPYYPLSKTSSFTNYQKNSFLDKEQKKLSDIFRKLDKKQCKIMLSNSEHPFIRELYKEFDIKTVRAKRMISCNNKGRGVIKELIIRNY